MALGSDKSIDEWVSEYELAHQHPVNKACHRVGIPMIIVSLMVLVIALIAKLKLLLWLAIGLFVVGWVLQFIGHAYEKKPPEFFRDWRFLLVGARWWLRSIGK